VKDDASSLRFIDCSADCQLGFTMSVIMSSFKTIHHSILAASIDTRASSDTNQNQRPAKSKEAVSMMVAVPRTLGFSRASL